MSATSQVIRIVAAVLIVLALAGCDSVATGWPLGWRQFMITIRNESNMTATLAVADDPGALGRVVGTAEPSVVPPGATMAVTFRVPAEGEWAIFLNPRPGDKAWLPASAVPADAPTDSPFARRAIHADEPLPPGPLPTWPPDDFANEYR